MRHAGTPQCLCSCLPLQQLDQHHHEKQLSTHLYMCKLILPNHTQCSYCLFVLLGHSYHRINNMFRRNFYATDSFGKLLLKLIKMYISIHYILCFFDIEFHRRQERNINIFLLGNIVFSGFCCHKATSVFYINN